MTELNRRDAVKAPAATALGVAAVAAEAEAQPAGDQGGWRQSFTEADISTYEKVAKIIGEVFDDSYKKIIKKLAGGHTNLHELGLEAGDRDGIKEDELAIFFNLLNNSQYSIEFGPRVRKALKGEIKEAENIAVTFQHARRREAFGGSVGVTGTVTF